MKLATLTNGLPDGMLAVISDDGQRFLAADAIAPTLQAALDRWTDAEPALRVLANRLAEGGGAPLVDEQVLAPLPRAWQWLDGSTYPSHAALMRHAFDLPAIPTGRPLVYQGMSHQFLSPTVDVPIPSEDDGIDFEGEFGVITDFVPMGVSAGEALSHIKLVVMINDWSLRNIAPIEMRTGFGWIQAKPACAVAPFAVTPDVLGGAWRNGRLYMDLTIDFRGARFGNANGGPMEYGFADLIAHVALTRSLPAGTIVGSGTISNDSFREVGSSCIAERRGIETIDGGGATTAFMRFGERVRLEAFGKDGASVFGAIDQRVVRG